LEKEAKTFYPFVLQNGFLRVSVCRDGGRLTAVEVADRLGRFHHVLLGGDDAGLYAKAPSFAALLGRYANRIRGGTFELDGQRFSLACNDGPNILHGGPGGFHRVVWDVVARSDIELALQFVSPDGDQGFPGEVTARAVYRLDGAALHLELTATTTRATVINFSTHPYFNLGGPACSDIGGHALSVFADAYLPTDAEQIPIGVAQPVDGSAFDYRNPVLLADRLAARLDHCFVLSGASSPRRLAARLVHAESGRGLDVYTTEPGLQVYTAYKFDGSLVGRGGAYRRWAGLALEPQHFPDAPNQPNFPSTVLRPGERFCAVNVFSFTG
jgi:aldose 1-epimerase